MSSKRPLNTKTLIRQIFAEHRDWNAKQIYDEYCFQLGDAKSAVTLNAVQKQVQKLRGPLAEIEKTGRDKAWNFGLLRDPDFTRLNPGFSIDPEALDYIILLQAMAKSNGFPFTARQVFWANLFFRRFENARYGRKNIETYYAITRVYSEYELLCALEAKEFDTTILDTQSFTRGFSEENLIRHLNGLADAAPDSSKPQVIETVNSLIHIIRFLQEAMNRPQGSEADYWRNVRLEGSGNSEGGNR